MNKGQGKTQTSQTRKKVTGKVTKPRKSRVKSSTLPGVSFLTIEEAKQSFNVLLNGYKNGLIADRKVKTLLYGASLILGFLRLEAEINLEVRIGKLEEAFRELKENAE